MLARYLGPDERVLIQTRQHPFAVGASFFDAMRLLVPMLLMSWGLRGITLGGVLMVPVLGAPIRRWILLVIFLGACVVIGRFVWRVLAWELERVLITTEKVVHIRGVLNRRIASTPLVKIGELTVSQPLLGRVFHYGALVVESEGGDRALHGLRHLPDPADVWRLVTQTARSQRAWEGGAKAHAADAVEAAVAEPSLADDASDHASTTVIARVEGT